MPTSAKKLYPYGAIVLPLPSGIQKDNKCDMCCVVCIVLSSTCLVISGKDYKQRDEDWQDSDSWAQYNLKVCHSWKEGRLEGYVGEEKRRVLMERPPTTYLLPSYSALYMYSVSLTICYGHCTQCKHPAHCCVLGCTEKGGALPTVTTLTAQGMTIMCLFVVQVIIAN